MLRRSITFSCMLMALMMTMGCNWDSGLYKELVNDNGRIVRCPPVIAGSGENVEIKFPSLNCKKNTIQLLSGDFKDLEELQDSIDPNTNKCKQDGKRELCNEYIFDYLACKNFQSNGFFDDVKKSGNISYVGAGENLIGKYPDSQKHNICPTDYPICSFKSNKNNEELVFGCIDVKDIENKIEITEVKECSEGQIICDEKCVTPGEFGHYCGAKGGCSSDDPSSPDYKGITCSNELICDNGECRCDDGLIECDGKCINPNADMNHCGATDDCKQNGGAKCPESGYCDNGKCKCQEGYIDCDGVCINPNFDDKYCGAKELCKDRGVACETNEQCRNGVCVLMFCQDKNRCAETVGSEKFKCVDVSLDDDENCGACNLKCASNDTANNKCQSGKCNIISCKDNLTKCPRRDNDGKILNDFICVDATTNLYCGSKCNYCDGDTYCKDGKCEKTTCPAKPNTCLNDPNNCNNRVDACGTSCVDCNQISHAKNVSCNNETGICQFDCEPPFEKNNSVCGCDSVDYCRGKIEGWKDGICMDGECFLTACSAEYELYDESGKKICIKKEELCEGVRDCLLLLSGNNHNSHIVETDCSDNKCIVKKCEQGFHISKDKRNCVQNTVSDCAPPDESFSVNCNSIDRWKNVTCDASGMCIAGGCKDYGSFKNGACIRDRNYGHDCSSSDCKPDNGADASNAYTMYCRSSGDYQGYEILACKAGYEKVKEYKDYDFCEHSCSICYIEGERYYHFVCRKHE